MTRRFATCLATGLLVAFVACAGHGASRPSDGSAPTSSSPALTETWAWVSPGGFSPGLPGVGGDDTAATWSHQLLVLFDAAGAPRWQAPRVGLLEVAPALTPDLVLASTEDGVVAYDRLSGQLRWQAVLGEQPTTPVVAAGRVVVTTWEGSLLALEPGDGRVAWRTKLGGPSLGPAAASGSTVVATFDDGLVAGASAVDAATGRPRWTAPLPSGGVSAAAVASNGIVSVVAGDVAAHGLSIDDGARRWRTALEGSGSPEVPPLALPDGTVVVGHRLGGMALLDSHDGTVRWQTASHGAAVRGGPAGPGPNGWFAMPLHDGRLLLAGAGRPDSLRVTPGFVRGVARGAGGTLLMGVGRGDDNRLSALRGW